MHSRSYRNVEQMAIDWLSGNFYFVDRISDRIFVCNHNKDACVTLIDLDLHNPKGIALDPLMGKLFFTDYGNAAKVERCNMDGTNRTRIVDSKTEQPTAIALDLVKKLVYWADVYLDYIGVVDYDGKNRHTIIQGENVKCLYGLTVFEDYLYASSCDIIRGSKVDILKINRFNSTVLQNLTTMENARSIHVYHKLTQPTEPKTELFLFYGKGRPGIIRGMDLNTKSADEYMIQIENLVNPRALDFHAEANYIYFADTTSFLIGRQKIDGTGRETILKDDLDNVEGISVDWIGNNLYWTNDGHRKTISVARLEKASQTRKTLLEGEMSHPRGIVVDPLNGWMYWTDWEEDEVNDSIGRIEKAWMDGSNRQNFVTSKMLWPNGLTLDYANSKLYWCDAYYDHIEQIFLNGTKRMVVYNGKELNHPFGISHYRNYIFWTDYMNGSIFQLDLLTKNVTLLRSERPPLFVLRVYDAQHQQGDNACRVNYGGCSTLCLAIPGGRVCACADNQHMEKNNVTCSTQTCQPNQYSCVNGRCIPQTWLCDRDDDCGDKSDEAPSCAMHPLGDCNSEEFYCHTDGTCVPERWHCDGDKDCEDGSDERNCEGTRRMCDPKSKFTCKVSGVTGIEVVVQHGLATPEGLAVDWIAGNFYWIDSNLDQIEVAKLDGTMRTTLIAGAMEHPRAIALDPQHGILFWTDWDATFPRIEAASMSGVGRHIIFKDMEIGAWPNGLTVDHLESRIVWTDARSDAIYSALYDGTGRIEILRGHEYLSHPFAVSLFGGYVYWTDWRTNTLAKANKWNGRNVTVIQKTSAQPFDLQIYHPSRQPQGDKLWWADENSAQFGTVNKKDGRNPVVLRNKTAGVVHIKVYDKDGQKGRNPCQLNNGGCSQLCLPTSANTRTCSCTVGYDLRNDRMSCEGIGSFLMYSIHEGIRGISLDPSDSTETLMPITGTLFAVGVDFHAENDTIYWTDMGLNRISRAKRDQTWKEDIITNGIGRVEGIAVDWISGNIYWTDHSFNLIEVARLNGSFRSVVLSDGLDQPRAIAVHPEKGAHANGSIRRGFKSDATDALTIRSGLGINLKDVKVFNRAQEKGTNPCAKNNGGCQQLCFYLGNGRRTCACAHGYLSEDGLHCQNYDGYLLYSERTILKSIHLSDETNLNSPIKPYENPAYFKNVIALAFDYSQRVKGTNRIFFSDVHFGNIQVINDDWTGRHIIVERLAYHRAWDTLYWTSSTTSTITRHTIDLTRPGAFSREAVIIMSEEDHPHVLALDECQNLMFWTNWNEQHPSIMRATLAGNNIQVIVSTDIVTPNGLTIDHKAEKLYFSDGSLGKIERCEYDGSHRYVIVKSGPGTFFGLAIYGDFIFWSDWVRRAILRSNKYTGGEMKVLRADIPHQPMGIVAVANDTNSSKNSLCSIHTEFECANGECIDYQLTCDGIAHCKDKSDEKMQYCDNRNCRKGFKRCYNQRCVANSRFCDGLDDCGDNSDEVNCNKSLCNGSFFMCANGRCIPVGGLCNKEDDCGDGSDERNCNVNECLNRRISGCSQECQDLPLGYKIVHRTAVPSALAVDWIGKNLYWCDTERKSVEVSKANGLYPTILVSSGLKNPKDLALDTQTGYVYWIDCCESPHIGRVGMDGTYQSVVIDTEVSRPVALTIDYINRRLYWADENHILFSNMDGSNRQKDSYVCLSGQFKCTKKQKCIPLNLRCNGQEDCGDGEDETDCHEKTCGPHEFHCQNNNCIPDHWRCDSQNDCGDNSDEENCTPSEDMCEGKINPCGEDAVCNQTKTAAVCRCKPGFQRNQKDKQCKEIDECLQFDSCSHYCTNTKGSFKCACHRNYREINGTCKAKGPEDQVLYIANDTEIRGFVYPFNQSHGHKQLARIEDNARIIGMDALYQGHKIIWGTQFNPGILQPHQIDIFEDYIFGAGLKNNVFKVHKYGHKPVEYIDSGLEKATSVLVSHRYKQPDRKPTCRCTLGFTGPNCERRMCDHFCLNDGTCEISQGNQPLCRCPADYTGDRCQYRKCCIT
ncbi:Low-density lipoprotein receptor-related protein 1B [Acipenser ruthenus]|uniref:Low-density lipoprotein receptor-related protein 1B n=1 Tax=Acipenser ruthenus TaxID=7906 RepID=A0A662YX41_ACIRT|nr:Low-density lipoprotein receptor-related protein 1B [Acipenser ruthenus]